MKKIFFLLGISLLIFTNFEGYSQKVDMKVGVPIEIGTKKGKVVFLQDGKQLDLNSMVKTLKGIEASKNNISLAHKCGSKKVTFMVVGIATIPIGLLIFNHAVQKNTRKQHEYLSLAVEDYNKSLNTVKAL
jgi:hypothetical protein